MNDIIVKDRFQFKCPHSSPGAGTGTNSWYGGGGHTTPLFWCRDRREQRSLRVEGGGAALSREQQEAAEVTAGHGRGHSFKEGAAGGSTGHWGSRERGRSFKEGAAGGSRGHCRWRERAQLQGGSSRREQRSLQVEAGVQLQGGRSRREQRSLQVEGGV